MHVRVSVSALCPHQTRSRKSSSSSFSSSPPTQQYTPHPPTQIDLAAGNFEEMPSVVDSEEIIQQLDDHIDETDNILMRTSEQAVAESIADLARDSPDERTDSDLENLESVDQYQSQDHLTGSAVSIASLASSSPEVPTQLDLNQSIEPDFEPNRPAAEDNGDEELL